MEYCLTSQNVWTRKIRFPYPTGYYLSKTFIHVIWAEHYKGPRIGHYPLPLPTSSTFEHCRGHSHVEVTPLSGRLVDLHITLSQSWLFLEDDALWDIVRRMYLELTGSVPCRHGIRGGDWKVITTKYVWCTYAFLSSYIGSTMLLNSNPILVHQDILEFSYITLVMNWQIAGLIE
jgi:hypothetical protein